MMSPVAIGSQSTIGVPVTVADADTGQSTCNLRIIVKQKGRHRSGVAGIEVSDISISHSLPISGELISQLYITTKLFKLIVVTVSVRTLILSAYNTTEATLTEAVYTISLNSSVTATLQADVCLTSILAHLACNDVHYATHSIAAIQQAGRTAKHLNLLCHHCLIGIRYGMPHKASILRLSVYEHQQLGTTAYPTNLQASCGTSANTIA